MVGGLTASDDRHSPGMGGTSFVVSSSSGLHFPDTDGASLGVMSSNFRCVFLSVSESVSIGSLGSSGMASLSVSVHSFGMSGASLVKADGSLGVSGSIGLHSLDMGGASLGVTSSNGLHSLAMSDTSGVSSTFGSEYSGTVSSRSDGSSTGKVSTSSGSGFSLSSSKGFQGFGSSEGRGLSFGKSGTGKGSASLGNLGSSNTSSFHEFGHTFLVSKGSGSEVFSSPLGSDVSEVLSTDFRGKGSGFSFNDGMESLGMSDSSTSSSTFGSEDSGMVSSSSSEFSTGIGSASSGNGSGFSGSVSFNSLGMSHTSSVSSTFVSEDSHTVSSSSDGSSMGELNLSEGSGFSLNCSEGFQGFGSAVGSGLSFGSSDAGKVGTSLGNLGSSDTFGFQEFGHTFDVSKGSGFEVFSSFDDSNFPEVTSKSSSGSCLGFGGFDGSSSGNYSLGMSGSGLGFGGFDGSGSGNYSLGMSGSGLGFGFGGFDGSDSLGMSGSSLGMISFYKGSAFSFYKGSAFERSEDDISLLYGLSLLDGVVSSLAVSGKFLVGGISHLSDGVFNIGNLNGGCVGGGGEDRKSGDESEDLSHKSLFIPH